MNYYFTVNGIPACAAEETLDTRLDPPTVCSHKTKASAQAHAQRVQKLYPSAVITIVEGRCPQPNAYSWQDDECNN